jgi:hypothetical protein
MRYRSNESRPRFLSLLTGLTCLAALSLALVGCGSDSTTTTIGTGGTTSTGPDHTPDFAISSDAGLNNAFFVAPGQTLPVVLDLVSANGFSKAITLSVGQVPTGWTAVFDTPTVNSLPKGTTKVTLRIAAPANAMPTDAPGGFQVKATSGSIVRYLDGGNVYVPSDGGQVSVTVAGVTLQTFTAGQSPFAVASAGTASTPTGAISINGAGLTGPVTVSLTNNNPGLTVTLPKTTFTPSDNYLSDTVQLQANIPASLPGGGYAMTLTAKTADGKTVQSPFYLYVEQVTFVAQPTLSLGSAAGSTASVGADVTISGPGTAAVQVTVTGLPGGVQVVPSPATVTIPASGSIKQHFTLQASTAQKLPTVEFVLFLNFIYPDKSQTSLTFPLKIH